ncbi:MAG: hypothetical protein AB1668_00560 [Nanoarchaeota archaeon]
MKEEKKLELLHKGWKEEEVKHAEEMLEKVQKHDIFFSKMVFWSALVVIVFANLLVSLILVPFLIVLNEWMLYVITAVLAGTVGFLYNFLITDIGLLEKKHHRIASIIVPILALGNMLITVFVSNHFIAKLNFVDNPQHNPLLLGIVFGAAFILPYVVMQVRKKP